MLRPSGIGQVAYKHRASAGLNAVRIKAAE